MKSVFLFPIVLIPDSIRVVSTRVLADGRRKVSRTSLAVAGYVQANLTDCQLWAMDVGNADANYVYRSKGLYCFWSVNVYKLKLG